MIFVVQQLILLGNYANDIGGKIKWVTLNLRECQFISDFFKSIRMLLDGDGHSFINYYYSMIRFIIIKYH
jgi:hypothetical protein